MPSINKIFILAVSFLVFSTQAMAEEPRSKSSDKVGTVEEQGGSWYAIAKTGLGKKKLYTKGDIFCSDVDITHCLRVRDINKDSLVLEDTGSKKVFTVKPGNRIPLEGTDIIFEKSVAVDVVEYRYNDTSGANRGLVEDFTVKELERKKVVVEKDYDKDFLPKDITEEEKELFGMPMSRNENPEKIKASLFEQIKIEKIGKDSWAVDTEKVDMALGNIGKALFSAIKGVEPRYRFGKGPSLKFNSELGDVIVSKEGFLVQNLAVGNILERAGIQRGDLIKSINGQPVNSLYGIYKAYTSVKSDKNMKITTLEIIRDGKTKILTYKVR
ncbi:MAG: PDZ domain-containing protein [Candidatus Omnitrophota bacterium]